MANIFICLRCGSENEQSKHNNRKYCPECAVAMRLERSRVSSAERNVAVKESIAIKNLQQKKEVNALADAKKAADAELDARSAKQRKLQCRFCKYRLRCGTNGTITAGCDYVSWEGHSRDKGNGPGDCRSFAPESEETKAERIERRRGAMQKSEANHAFNYGEKMRKENS